MEAPNTGTQEVTDPGTQLDEVFLGVVAGEEAQTTGELLAKAHHNLAQESGSPEPNVPLLTKAYNNLARLLGVTPQTATAVNVASTLNGGHALYLDELSDKEGPHQACLVSTLLRAIAQSTGFRGKYPVVAEC